MSQEDSDNFPRLLTDSEIEEILRDSIPDVLSASLETSEAFKHKIYRRLRDQLREITITPLAKEDLKAEIRKTYFKSLVNPGTSVGIMAAEAMSHPITQMVLNSFKSSGMAKQLVTGVDKARNLIYLSKNVKNPYCKVFFTKNFTFEELFLNKYREIVGISVGQLVEDYNIGEIKREWWYSYFKTSEYRALSDMIELDRIRLNVRLKLKRSLLYHHRLTTSRVSKAIEEYFASSHSKKPVVCFYSPTLQGIIDIFYISDRVINDIRSDTLAFTTFSVEIVPELDKIIVSGIPEIKELNIDKINLKMPFINEVKVTDKSSGNNASNLTKYVINLNPNLSRASGITPEHYKRILHKLKGVKNVEIRDYSIEVEVSQEELGSDRQMEQAKTPMSVIEDIIRKEDEQEEIFEDENPTKFYEHSDIYRDYYIYYIETDGTNLRELIKKKDVDYRRIVSNDPEEIYEVFGIEAVRNFLINELITTLSMDKSYIDPRHVILLADFQTYLGVLTPATYSGVQKQPIGSLSKATFEKPLDIFKKKAPFGQIDEVKSVSASVALGCPIPLGTGKVIVEEDLSNIRAEKAIERINTTTCEPIETKVQFQIESEDNRNVIKKDINLIPQSPRSESELWSGSEIDLSEEMYRKIGADIRKEIEMIKDNIAPEVSEETEKHEAEIDEYTEKTRKKKVKEEARDPEVTPLVDFLKSKKI
jgi:DNA-directed RNA polymerase beta' subunit